MKVAPLFNPWLAPLMRQQGMCRALLADLRFCRSLIMNLADGRITPR